ncbi:MULTISPECIES: ABC transporter ATP-binding protein [unclassified Pseudofrankia]|uniref:ABC transporter ATP-binding protein n=1 Tax=unclassified Pseudofrankia TaxID=2994372 RepID=UPI0009F2C560|nr:MULTISPECIES: ABC transporter ATP-binding protein [unclassified Pseudofrankia]MDT3441441.1 ABC transporter ATP-binding protein [Pseudofrankia sp. BMG5.37]
MSTPHTSTSRAPGPAAATTAARPAQPNVVLSVHDLNTTFAAGSRTSNVVRGVSFDLRRGQTLMLLGESGSGKSVTARSIMRLYGRNATITGSVRLSGQELLDLSADRMRGVRGARIALVPQDPTGSLDPLRRIGAQITEVLALHNVERLRRAGRRQAEELLRLVGINDPKRVADSYPHELSGGMRQRAVIAIAVSCDPEVLIADEPTTALDVTVQKQILELFADLQDRLGMATLMVTHDVGVAAEAGDRVGVMYAGRLVEEGPAAQVFASPRHPYTAGLLAALPSPGVPRGTLRSIPGSPPPAGAFPAGCAFAPRCPVARDSCRTDDPPLVAVAPDRSVACPVVNPASPSAPPSTPTAGAVDIPSPAAPPADQPSALSKGGPR